MNTTSSTPADSTSPSIKSVVETLVGLGTSWAAFGLKIGKQALVHSAETLGKTADTLESLAVAMEKKGASLGEEKSPGGERGDSPAASVEAPAEAPAEAAPGA